MDQSLLAAIDHFVQRLGDHLIEDLLLLQVDWGAQTPPVSPDTASLSFQGRLWPLVYTDSELVLRRVLCQGQAIFVLPGRVTTPAEVPRDILARADRGRVYPLGWRDRLHALSGRDWPPEVDYADWRPVIERHADHLVRQAGETELNWPVTRDQLETMLVKAVFGLTVAGQDAPRLLAGLVASQRKQEGVASTELERSLLQGQLRAHQVPWAEVVVWAAEAQGQAEEIVRTGLMMAVEQAARFQPNWGNLHGLRARLISERQLAEKDAVAGVMELATQALQHLHPSTRQAIVAEAEKILLPILPLDAYNPWFFEVLKREINQVAQRLSVRDLQALSRVQPLADHLAAKQAQPQLDALGDIAALVTQWAEQAGRVETLSSAAAWGNWYAGAGAQMDLAALRLQQKQGTGLDEPIQHLLGNYWAWRDKLNAAFAKTFVEGYEAALHDRQAGVFGTHRLLSWVVRPLLQAGRRVLVLVIDGMGSAAFWHLLNQWAHQTPPVYAGQGPFPGGQVSALLALLPSVTSVSRKGLFLDALPTDRLDDEAAYEDKARTGEKEALARAFPHRATRLYNKSNLDSGQKLRDEIQFQSADVIVAIFNAIDDDLKSATTSVRLPHLADLGPLVNIVRTALEANWAVVVTADHGHTWHRDKELRRGAVVAGGGERFMPLEPKDTPPAGSIVTADEHIVRVQDGQRVAFLTTTGAYFGHNPRRGYHGGAGLEEIVVPCALLTLEPPAVPAGDRPAGAVEPEQPVQEVDRSGVVLTLPDKRITSLDLPFILSPVEIKLLQALARLGEASEADLKQAVSSRRIAGPLAGLLERLAGAGPDYEFIEQKGSGAGGTVYRFRIELLK